MASTFSFSRSVLTWFDRAGRKHLPWQQNITPYRVWLSEIMLQQTQVNTVIPYFERFTAQFPDIFSLAAAEQDTVLALWTGLGYYSRARNLHRTAKIICAEHNGIFPDTVAALSTLPGIGRSTAAAIVSIAYQKPAAILDGNVKRVLARFHAVSGWTGDTATAKQLWHYAEQHTPKKRAGDYTQAMMDLGATLCTRSKPQCTRCPLHKACAAYREDTVALYPGKKNAKTLPTKSVAMFMLRNRNQEILLQQRAPTGLWGGLWCLPEFSADADITQACQTLCQKKPRRTEIWPSWKHSFSHYHLDITPVLIEVDSTANAVTEPNARWIKISDAQTFGMPAPAVRLLAQLSAC
jgi:A/G-specific adenine glycosylase